MARSKDTKRVTKSVRLSPEESAHIEQVRQRAYLPEGTLMRKLVLEGLDRYRPDQAIGDYENGDLNLGEAARRRPGRRPATPPHLRYSATSTRDPAS